MYSLCELKLLGNKNEDRSDDDPNSIWSSLKRQYSDDKHLAHVLERLKVPPVCTTCRLTHRSQRDRAMEGIRAFLRETYSSSSDRPQRYNIRVEAHSVLPDMICIYSDTIATRECSSIDVCNSSTSSAQESKHDKPLKAGFHDADDDLYHCRVPPGPSTSSSSTADASTKDEKIEQGNNDDVKRHEDNWRHRAGWPAHCKVVIADRVCGEAVLRGAPVFVKGVMVAEGSLQKGDDVAVYADLGASSRASAAGHQFTRGLSLQMYSTMITKQAQQHGSRRRCVLVGVGSAECSRTDIFSTSNGVAVTLQQTAGPWQPSMRDFIEEMSMSIPMLLQNVPSALVAHVLLQDDDWNDDHASPSCSAGSQKSKLMILDMCAAPGGKASHVAALAAPGSALVVACDKSRRKVVAMRQLFQRLGVSHNTVPLMLNTTQCVIDNGKSTGKGSKANNVVPLGTTIEAIFANAKPSEVDGLLQVQGFPPASFDRILLDPPCSALGLRPKLHINNDFDDLLASVCYQKKFVNTAVQLLKPGGILSYSTCTISSGENEGMVRYILDQYGGCDGMELLPIVSNPTNPLALLGGPGLPHEGLDPAQCACVRRFDPANTVEDTMGFFLAKFRKKRQGNHHVSNAVHNMKS